jgi:hypothetical protein
MLLFAANNNAKTCTIPVVFSSDRRRVQRILLVPRRTGPPDQGHGFFFVFRIMHSTTAPESLSRLYTISLQTESTLRLCIYRSLCTRIREKTDSPASPPPVVFKPSDATSTEMYMYIARVPRLVHQTTVCPRGNNSQLSILL